MTSLPRPAPDDPLPLARRWLDSAAGNAAKNPWAMALATVAADGRPSLRYVLLKSLDAAAGHVVFYTNYDSRKAIELAANPRAAGTLYWPEPGRQLRFEGRVERSPAAESEAYFASRARLSQLNAWASAQSRPLAAPDAMAARLAEQEARFAAATTIPRPPNWGGYRLALEAVEFWVEGADRFHERLRYERAGAGDWTSTWLQP